MKKVFCIMWFAGLFIFLSGCTSVPKVEQRLPEIKEFNGTWRDSSGMTIVFSENNFSYTGRYRGEGFFTFTNADITFSVNDTIYRYNYQLTDNVLKLTKLLSSKGPFSVGDYKKMPEENELSSDSGKQISKLEAAVQECYNLAAETLFYSIDGINSTAMNRIKGSNEIAGVCTDYSLEFAYYWNEVRNYDDLYGKAYLARIPSTGSTFDIFDFRFAPNGTSKIREQSGNFEINGNDRENDGVFRDAIIISKVYSGQPIKHFNQNTKNHKWIVIKYDEDWYDCEPTWYDTNSNSSFLPYKINL